MDIITNSKDFWVDEDYYHTEELEYYAKCGLIERKGYNYDEQPMYKISSRKCKSIDILYNEKEKKYHTYVITHSNHMIIVVI